MGIKVVISGLPGCQKTDIAEGVAEEMHWQVFNVGAVFRKLWKDLGCPCGRFDIWANQLSMDELERIHKEARRTIESIDGNLVIETRNYMLLSGLTDIYTFFVKGDVQERSKIICQRKERDEKYPGLTAAEIAPILVQREAREVIASLELFKCDHRTLPYNKVIDSPALGVEASIKEIVRTLPATA